MFTFLKRNIKQQIFNPNTLNYFIIKNKLHGIVTRCSRRWVPWRSTTSLFFIFSEVKYQKQPIFWHIQFFSITTMYIQNHSCSFCWRFWKILYFCGNNGPLHNIILAPCKIEQDLLNFIEPLLNNMYIDPQLSFWCKTLLCK